MYIRCFMKIDYPLHWTHLPIQFHHIILQLSPIAIRSRSTAVIDIGLAVVINEHTRINGRRRPLDIAHDLKPAGRFVTNSHANLPAMKGLGFAGVWKIEIVFPILIGTVGCPHPSSLLTSPRHLALTQYLTMVNPMYHIIC